METPLWAVHRSVLQSSDPLLGSTEELLTLRIVETPNSKVLNLFDNCFLSRCFGPLKGKNRAQ